MSSDAPDDAGDLTQQLREDYDDVYSDVLARLLAGEMPDEVFATLGREFDLERSVRWSALIDAVRFHRFGESVPTADAVALCEYRFPPIGGE